MNDRAENNLSMAHAVNNYLGSTAAALLTVNATINATITARKATLAADLTAVGTLLGNKATLAGEGLGATAAKKLSRAEFNRLILKISNGLVSAFTAAGDLENATAVRFTKSKVARTRDQDLPALAALLSTKATIPGSGLSAHNVTPAELTQLATTAASWTGTASKGTAKKSSSTASHHAAEEKVDSIVKFLKNVLDPLIKTYSLSTVEAERTAAAGYFAARTVIDLHGPGNPEAPEPPPAPPTP